MRTKVLSDKSLQSLRRHPALYRLARQVRFAVGEVLPPTSVPGVPGRVHRNDFMLRSTGAADGRDYAGSAQATLGAIDAALAAAGLTRADVARWLDCGCGYGRILRFLAQGVPADRIWAADILSDAVAFCAKEFGVHPVGDVDDLTTSPDLLGGFDFIYAISVFTHLPLAKADAQARALTGALAPGGILLFTTHGPATLAAPEYYGPEFAGKGPEIADRLERDGSCYLPYSHSKDGTYGMAWHTEPYVRRMLERAAVHPVSLIRYEPRGLEQHQDVYAFRRLP